jgi:minor curlin subunit
MKTIRSVRRLVLPACALLLITHSRAGDLAPSELRAPAAAPALSKPASDAAARLFAGLAAQQTQVSVTQDGTANSASVQQDGLENQAFVQQSGQQNDASIVQNGLRNRADIEQHGVLNAARIEQYGQQGTARITQYGNGKTATITQH